MSKINGLLDEELPREKLIKFGVDNLTNVELLAILLRTGTKNKNVLELSREILNVFEINFISRRSYDEIIKFNGINTAKACIILATFELSRRLSSTSCEKIKITSSKELFEFVKSDFFNLTIEKVMVVFIGSKNQYIKKEFISCGFVNSSNIDFRDIVKSALTYDSSGIFLIHNHPSQDLNPSIEDIEITNKLISLLNDLNLRFLDHIIVSNNSYYSLFDNEKI